MKKKIIFASSSHTYVYFRYEKLTLFCFFCAHLGHNDSFCQLCMSRKEESVELGWDLSV